MLLVLVLLFFRSSERPSSRFGGKGSGSRERPSSRLSSNSKSRGSLSNSEDDDMELDLSSLRDLMGTVSKCTTELSNLKINILNQTKD